ncbi:TRAP transporter 4TM/12TM fusion protein [Ancylobacter aquaticus]|uniref:TRAP transporter 4TM/12TM fusion protein n=1 Tax=Ancylobacter aquaticus TaxID=100 RepID=A0A4R1HQM0_ANCAQ|nr:TRAP transporter fused permease subunit [Ancylobacter aquaticus]TCK19642.1 TRAP transporter 4TM/12TM fusion protein [Ancylobacter aquaticus]
MTDVVVIAQGSLSYSRRVAILVVGLALIALTVFTSATIPLPPTVQRGLFVLGIVYLGLLLKPLPGGFVLLDILLAAGATISFGYLVANWEVLAYRALFEPALHEVILGLVALVSVIELTRRLVGWPIALLTVIAFLYALYGRYLPDAFAHRGFSVERIVNSQYLTHEGLFGSLTGVAVTLVAMFLVFGALVQQVGVADLFMKLAAKLSFGKFGGPGKIEVVSSALMGTISGSSTANVVTTGTTTIPMMRRAGFSPTFAASVEAVSSTGGQLMPPVLGVAAFLMAELTGIPFGTIALASLIPAVLYFVCVFVEVDLESRKLTLVTDWDDAGRASLKEIIRKIYLLLPIVVLAYFLFAMYSPTKAAYYACITALIVGVPKWKELLTAAAGKQFVMDFVTSATTVVLACACAGIIVGILSLTGATMSLSYALVELAGDNYFLLLVFVMFLCIILGMGLPTPAAYAVAAAFAAPMLVQAGVQILAAHMFVLFYASLSSITPPVAVAAYAAAGIANASPMRVAVTATKLGLSAFIIPFVFVQDPAILIGQAPIVDTVIVSVTALLGVTALGLSTIGYYRGPVSMIERLGYFAAAIMMMMPSVLLSLGGMVLAAVLLVIHFRTYPAENTKHSQELQRI